MRSVTCLAVVLTSGVGIGTLAAQNPPTTRYLRTLCIKVQPGKDAEYRKLASSVSKAVAQVRADAGEFSSRLLLRSVFPAGTEAACDYTVAYVYPGFPPDVKAGISPEAAHEKAQVMSRSEFVAKLETLTRMRRTELWRLRETLGSPAAGNYIRLNYVKIQPEELAPWLKLESETFKPVHQARMDLGAVKAWGVETLAMPTGSLLPYNAATIDIFKDWTSIGAPTRYEEAFKKTGKDMAASFAESAKLRGAFVRTELYEVVDITIPSKSAATSGQR